MIEKIIERASRSVFGKPLVSNNYRGLIVEAIVAESLEPDWRWVSEDWAAWDFERSDGKRLEVKQSAALQSWHRSGFSTPKPRFDCAPRTGRWEGSKWFAEPGRFADIYVFAYHSEKDPEVADHRDPDQWQFLVVSENLLPDQKTIALSRLLKLGGMVGFDQLCGAVNEVAKARKSNPQHPAPPQPL